jgi:GT2 family glycosyltransferase
MRDTDKIMLILAVNYCSEQYAVNYILNIKKIVIPPNYKIVVVVVDNSEHCTTRLAERVNGEGEHIRVIQGGSNSGYLAGIAFGYGYYRERYPLPEWVVVSNVDILNVDKDIISKLDSNSISNPCSITPRIMLNESDINLNPMFCERPTKKKLDRLLLVYRFYPVYVLYQTLANMKRMIAKLRSLKAPSITINEDQRQVYFGQGSFMIFSGDSIADGKLFEYPMFLYGEEIFLGEMLSEQHFPVYYDPTIVIKIDEHASTGSFYRKRKMVMHMYNSTKYLVDLLFKKGSSVSL